MFSFGAYGESVGTLEILDRRFHFDLGGDEVAIYGDYAAIYPEPFEPQQMRWVPRIDLPTLTEWHYERRRPEQGGYVECAMEIMKLGDWDDGFASKAWGAQQIKLTGNSGSPPQGFNSPANWIAARVNMHIERQREFQAAVADEDWW